MRRDREPHPAGAGPSRSTRSGSPDSRWRVVGFAQSRLDYNAVTPRRVHPINSLSTFTFRFVRPDGVTLYDFKGVNHSIIASIRYLVPKPTAAFDDKILNPGYEPNPLLGYAAVTTDSDPDSTADPDEDDELDEVLGNPTANDGFWSNDYRPIDPEYGNMKYHAMVERRLVRRGFEKV